MTIALIGFFVCLVLSGAFSGFETGLYSLERVRLQVRASRGDGLSARLLREIMAPAEAVGTILVTNNVVNYFVAFCSGTLLATMSDGALSDVEMELRNTAYVTPVLFIFGELVPKTLFMRFPGKLVPVVFPLYRVGRAVFAPILRPLLWTMSRLSGVEATSERASSLLARSEVFGMLTTDDEAERLSRGQKDLVKRILAVQGVEVRDRMVPLQRVDSVDLGAGRAEIVAIGVRTGRARLPVRDPKRGDFVGYVTVLDAAFESEAAFDLASSLHELPRVKERMIVTEALSLLQAARKPLAVVERAGRPVGIIATIDIVLALHGTAEEGVSSRRRTLAPGQTPRSRARPRVDIDR